jgi:hypothetical protein
MAAPYVVPCLATEYVDADLLQAVALCWHIDPLSKPVFRRLKDDNDESVFAFVQSTANVSQIDSSFSLSTAFSSDGLQPTVASRIGIERQAYREPWRQCCVQPWHHIAPLEVKCHNSKNSHFELCPQEVCLRPYLPSGIASHVYFLKSPREGRSVVVLLMRLHRPDPWFFLSPAKLYFSSCDSVLLVMRYEICALLGYYSTYSDNYQRFGTTCRSHLLGFFPLQDRTGRLSRNVGKGSPLYAA